ncbi:MAG TPA: recombinase family protein [bacterium]|nr:recombinase family protein [bacterium]
MKRMKKAVGYVCEIPIPGTDQVIGKEDQRARLTKWAEKEGVELITVFEDDAYNKDVMARPGVQKLLSCRERHNLVLCERIWAFARKNKDLEPLLAELDKQDVTLAASSYMWDMVSQQVRHRYAVNLAERAKKEAEARVEAASLKVVA